MRSLPQPDNRVLIGVGGSGKSTLALAWSEIFPRVIIVDPNAEPAHAELADVIDTQAELVKAAAADRFRLTWRLDLAAYPELSYDWATRVAWAAGDCCLVWDEVENYQLGGRLMPWGRRAWNQGRHRRLHVFALSRSPFQIDRALTRNVTRAAIFATQEPSDLRWLNDFIRDPAALDRIAHLARYQALDWRQGRPWCVRMSPFA